MIDTASLQKKLRETTELFPWYGSRFPDVVSQEPFELQSIELEQLPLLTAGILEQTYYRQPAFSDPTLSVYSTSGTSTGKRKSIYYSPQDDQAYLDIKTKLFGNWIRNTSVQKALADMGTGHAASTALTIFRRLGLDAEAVSFELPVERHIERLETFRPDLLYTMPSILDQIVHASHDPASYGVKKIILVGEIAAPEWQRSMAALFGIRPQDILDTLGSIEIGTIAAYSHTHGRYIIANGLYAEAIGTEQLPEDFEPLPDHEKVLVLTSFVRSHFPALRYVTYDVVRDFHSVEVDGVVRQSFACIAKRIGPELKHGEKISLYDIEDVVYRFLEDAQVRVELQNNKLSVHINSRSMTPPLLPLIRQAIEDKIPEIGAMIRNRILGEVEVKTAIDDESRNPRPVKAKKLYY